MIDKEKLIKKLDRWYEVRLEIKEFGIIQHSTRFFHMNVTDLLALEGLEKSELVIVDSGLNEYPYEARLKLGDYRLYAILSAEEYAKYFPEKVETQDDYIVIDGVKYRKEVQE